MVLHAIIAAVLATSRQIACRGSSPGGLLERAQKPRLLVKRLMKSLRRKKRMW